jgi:hypothetical protein
MDDVCALHPLRKLTGKDGITWMRSLRDLERNEARAILVEGELTRCCFGSGYNDPMATRN